MSGLALQGLGVTRNGRAVLSGVDLRIAPGEFVGLLGPNGAGKTTLLRAALGLLAAQGRSSLADLPEPARARAAAFVAQGRHIAWPMPVDSLVALGRIAHPGAARAADRAAIDRAIAALGLQALRHRQATELSGGEQAFTAICILFAILRLRPMPFCILDEIDAALDESNVDLFARYLKRFSDSTQYIVITHRKPTMEQADMLYGVTMQELGVSDVVSVSLKEAVKHSESK